MQGTNKTRLTFVFGFALFAGFLGLLFNLKQLMPLANLNLGWVQPALITFFVLNIKTFTTKATSN